MNDIDFCQVGYTANETYLKVVGQIGEDLVFVARPRSERTRRLGDEKRGTLNLFLSLNQFGSHELSL